MINEDMAVTVREEAESALQESEERYRTLVDNAPLGIVVRTGEKIVFANAAAANLLGAADPSQLVGRDALDIIDKEFHAQVAARRRITDIERKPAPPEERRLVRLDGKRVPAVLSAAPIMFDGRPSVQLVFRDITTEHTAREALQASEERYRRVIESINEGLLLLDPDGRVSFANEQICRITGWSAGELLGQCATEILASANSREILEMYRTKRARTADQCELKLLRKSGEEFFANVSGAPLLLDDRFAGSIVLISDISSRKLAETRVRESEEQFRELLDSMPTHVYSVDEQERFIAVNAAVCRMWGRKAEEIVGRTATELGMSEAIAEKWRRTSEAVRSSGQTVVHDNPFSTADRQARMIRCTMSPLRDSHGSIIGVSGIGIDITEQKKAEEAVQKLMHAVEHMDEIMFTTDRKGVITYVNPAFEKIYGYTREQTIGQTPRLLKSGQMTMQHYAHFWSEILAGRSVRTEYMNRTACGSLVRVIASVSPIMGQDGEVNGFICVQQDVTERRRAEEEQSRLEERMKHLAKLEALGTLAGGIAHDFNNILSIILSHTTVIERARGDQDRTQNAVATVKQAVQRGAALSKQILTFARRAETKVQPLHVSAVLREIKAMIAETFPRNIRIELDVDDSLPRISVDSGQVHQAVLNLCVNARDAMPSGGTLKMSARFIAQQKARVTSLDALPRDYVTVSVSDTGSGMPATVQEHLFEPFFTTKEKGEGTGLGLSVVYGVVKAHDGFIEFDTQPGQGTDFRLYFPALPQSS